MGKIVEKRLEGEIGRDYIERLSAEDARLGINSMGKLAQENAYGEIVSIEDTGMELPVTCGHGGSMWLCRACKNMILSKPEYKCLSTHGASGYAPGSYRDGEVVVCGACGERIENPRPNAWRNEYYTLREALRSWRALRAWWKNEPKATIQQWIL